MQQNRARCATPRGFLVFVCPAAIISERPPAKQIWLFFRRRRIIDQHHQNLAAIIFGRAFVVIPLLLRRIDTVTDENQWRLNDYVPHLRSCECHKIIGELKRFTLLAVCDVQLSFRIGFDANERYRLPKTSLGRGAFETHRFELFRDIKRREFAAARASAATFQSIVRKKFDMSPQRVFADCAR